MNASKKNAFENDHFILVEDIYRNTVLHSFAQQNKNKWGELSLANCEMRSSFKKKKNDSESQNQYTVGYARRCNKFV